MLGQQFVSCLNKYAVLTKSIKIELIHTNGWLKPSRLMELGGITAAEKEALK